MKFTISQRSEDRLLSTAFDSQIGKVIPLRTPDGVQQAKVTAASVDPDGYSYTLTLETDSVPWQEKETT